MQPDGEPKKPSVFIPSSIIGADCNPNNINCVTWIPSWSDNYNNLY